MFQIKVTTNNNNTKVLSFNEFARVCVLAKYNQLVSQGDILGFEVV